MKKSWHFNETTKLAVLHVPRPPITCFRNIGESSNRENNMVSHLIYHPARSYLQRVECCVAATVYSSSARNNRDHSSLESWCVCFDGNLSERSRSRVSMRNDVGEAILSSTHFHSTTININISNHVHQIVTKAKIEDKKPSNKIIIYE